MLRFYRDFSRAIPDELNTVGLLTTSPDGVPVVAIAVCYNGAIDAGEEVLQPRQSLWRTAGRSPPPYALHRDPEPGRLDGAHRGARTTEIELYDGHQRRGH